MGFEVGIADEIVKGEWVWAHDVAEICMHYVACRTSFKPPRHERHHRVNLPTIAGKTPHEVRTFFCLGTVSGDEPGNGLIVERGDEDFNVFGMHSNVALGEIEECLMERFWNL